MARFFAALLAAAAMLSVGSAAPYTFPNGTAHGVPTPTTTATSGQINVRSFLNTTTIESQKRGLRNFPVALQRPA